MVEPAPWHFVSASCPSVEALLGKTSSALVLTQDVRLVNCLYCREWLDAAAVTAAAQAQSIAGDDDESVIAMNGLLREAEWLRQRPAPLGMDEQGRRRCHVCLTRRGKAKVVFPSECAALAVVHAAVEKGHSRKVYQDGRCGFWHVSTRRDGALFHQGPQAQRACAFECRACGVPWHLPDECCQRDSIFRCARCESETTHPWLPLSCGPLEQRVARYVRREGSAS